MTKDIIICLNTRVLSLNVLNKQMANSSVISKTNEKQRNNYFSQVKNMINNFKKKIEMARKRIEACVNMSAHLFLAAHSAAI